MTDEPVRDADREEESAARPSQATLAVRLVSGPEYEYFRDTTGDPFVTVTEDGVRHTWPLRATEFERRLRRLFYLTEGRVPGGGAVRDALDTLEGRALFEGAERETFRRLAELDGRIYVDLGNDGGEAVEISPGGWRIVPDPPVRFVRARGMLPLPRPVPGGDLTALRRFVNTEGDADLRLILSWLVSLLRPRHPRPHLILLGEQGTAKSTTARVIRALIDPNVAPLRAAPADARDLMISAANSALLGLDNLSAIPGWLSDLFCCLATGGGYGTRALYTNDEETIFDLMRPVIITSIEQIVTRGDLFDRSLVISLPVIPPDRRRSEAAFWREFDALHPALLGALCAAAAHALGALGRVTLRDLPRMADFATVGAAAAAALGWTAADFITAYTGNRAEGNELALEASPLTPALRRLMDGTGEWTGTAGELLARLNGLAGEDARAARGWPKDAARLSNALKRLAPSLRATGLSIETLPREAGRRPLRLRAVGGAADRGDAGDTAAAGDHGAVISVTSVMSDTDPTAGVPDSPSDAGEDALSGPDDAARQIPAASSSPADAPSERASHAHDADDADDGIDPVPHPASVEDADRPELGTLECPPHTVITSAEQLRASLAELERQVAAAPAIGLDTETLGLDPHRDPLRLLTIALPDRTVTVDGASVDLTALAPVLGAARHVILHNATFDLRFLAAAGLPMPTGDRIFDTMLADQIVRAGLTADSREGCGLGEVAARYIGVALDKRAQTSDWGGELTEEQLRYAVTDAAVLLPLAERLDAELASYDLIQADIRATDLRTVAALEMRLVPAMAAMEHAGVPFDVERWVALSDDAVRRTVELEHQLDEVVGAGNKVNWRSPVQVGRILAARGHDLTVRKAGGEPVLTKQGKPRQSTDTETLKRLAADPLVDLVLEYREASKQADTYGLAFLQHVHPITGRIHSSFWQIGAVTGRMASGQPNLQNIPRAPAYRSCFRPPDGYAWVKADYGQIEARITAALAGDEAMLDVFRRGEDIHRRTAAAVFGIAEADVTKEQRNRAKAIVFGFLFGMGAETFVDYARTTYGVTFTLDEARRFRERFFAAFPGLRRWHRRHDGQQGGDTVTLGGRVRRRVQRWTELLNSQVQGTAADGIKLALARLWEDRPSRPAAEVVLVVHDEINVICPAGDAAATAAWLERHMVEAMQDLVPDVPIGVEVTIGRDWAGTPLED